MKNIKNHFGIKQTLTLALVASMLVQTFIGVMPAFATQEPSTASVNIGVTPLHVSGGASILANVTVNINNNADNWNSTGVYIGTSAPADLTPYICNDTTDHDTPGVYTEGLSIKAPNEAGTYTAYFLISKNGSDCKGNINNVVIRPTAGPIVVDTPAIFSLAYDGNGNTSGVVPSSATGYSGATVIVASYGDLVNANHTFISWNTKAGGDGANYAVGSEFTISGDATLYAKWEENPKYRLTYDANGGTGAGPLHQDEYVNTVVILNDENALKMANHTFDGWNTKADGTGTQYAAGDSYTITADVTLYAHWKEDNKYTLSYDDNGSTSGSGTAPASVSGYEDADIDVSDQGSLLKTNWTFVGWNTAVDGSGDSYDAGDEFKIGSSNAILYAQWEENEKYTLSYDGNDSTGGTAPVSAEYYEGQSVTVSGKGDLVKTGQTFDGWNTKANGSGTNYAAGSSITISGDDVTLYAKWKEATQFTLTYNSNGSTSGTAPVGGSYYDNESVAVSGKGDLARIGYSFTVWNTKADGTGANYVVASNITLTSDLTLYAKWTINSYTITFSSNGGTVIGSKTQDYGTAVTAPAAPTRLGYTFAGWDKVIPSTMACPEGYSGKINSYYDCVNDVSDDTDENAASAEQERLLAMQDFVGGIYGIDIQYSVHVNYTVVRDVINAIGGSINITIESQDSRGQMDSNFDWKCGASYWDRIENCPPSGHYIDYSNGDVTLDAEHALYLAQARGDAAPTYGFERSNFDREVNQRKILVAIRDKALSSGVLTNLGAVTSLIDALGSNLRTNIQTDEIRTILSIASEVKAADIHSLDMNKDGIMGSDGNPVAGVYNYSDIQDYIAKKLSSNPVVSEDAPIVVLNGTDQAGLGQSKANELQAAGYNIYYVDSAPDDTYTTTEIYQIGSSSSSTASALSKLFGVTIKTTEPPIAVDGTTQFVVVIGSDAISQD